MDKKVNIFVRGFRKVKGFFGTKAGKGVAIVSVIALGLTAAGTIIYKVLYSDGTEELIEESGEYTDVEVDTDVSLEAADDIETDSNSEEN